MEENDLLERVARRNPSPIAPLSESEQIRAEALLTRTMAEPHLEPSSRWKRKATRGLRVAGIAAAGLVGLSGAAWATGINPSSVGASVQILQAADAGTVVYSGAPAEDGAEALQQIIASTKASADLGVAGKTVLVESNSCVDAWGADNGGHPEAVCSERSDWTLPDGSWRYQQVGVSGPEGSPMNVFEEYDRRSGPNHDATTGVEISLGPTIADTEAALGQYDEEPWQMVDHYLGHYRMGIGLSSANRTAFLEALASYDYVYYGPATDSLGRVGEAFSVTRHFPGYTQEYRLVINPADGTLLAEEQVLHGPWILGSRDHVESSTTFVSSGNVADLTPCDETPGCEARQEG